MVPSDTVSSFGNKVYLASGNVQTCTAQGFFASLGVAASMSYYATLMVLYMLSVKHNWSENKMSNIRFRMYFILPPTIISLIAAVPPLFFEMYNWAGLYSCFLAPYPIDCGHEGYPDCERGHGEILNHVCSNYNINRYLTTFNSHYFYYQVAGYTKMHTGSIVWY